MPPANVSQAVHHPLQARILRERAQPLQVQVLIHVGAGQPKHDYLDFLIRQLTVAAQSPSHATN